ncbi:MAG: metallophosphoesterase family protein [Candidatus Latescibacterota bacterium]|nr:metallophosphoesterase family protein [Candidatus Latescibacterota bacterium]
MRVGILSDIHGNLEALESVLIALDPKRIDQIIVVGDLVGYGPDPVATLYRLRETDAVCVLGNHDHVLVDLSRSNEINCLARPTLLDSREMVSDDELDYIRTFAYRHVEQDGVFSHANPLKPEEWQHLYLLHHVEWCLQDMTWRVAFVGHTHHTAIYCQMEGQVVPLTSSAVAIGRHQYLVNVGSVGQPRDGDNRAAYAIWDTDSEHVELHRVEYPLHRTQQKITELGWPDYVAERLARGE